MADFPNNTETQGFSSTSSCCRRNCMPDSQCGLGQEGCLTDEDCDAGGMSPSYPPCNYCLLATGLQCDRNADRPSCIDIDECSGVLDSLQRVWMLISVVKTRETGPAV